MSGQMQRQRHGAQKHLIEGIGGLLIGAALVLLLRNRTKNRSKPAIPAATRKEATAEQEAEA